MHPVRSGMKGALQPVLGASHRGPARVALDLWRAGGSFRGFTAFALIGAIVLAFLGGVKVAGTPGYPRNVDGGRGLLERATAAGDAAAARVMGEGFLSGWMGLVDPLRARQYLQLASDRGNAEATYRLGEMLLT